MKLVEIYKALLEGVSDVVYHKVGSIQDTISILKSGNFNLTAVPGTNSDKSKNRGRSYYLSTARSKSGAYNRSSGDFGVTLVLDGRKLQSNYKAYPIDYWNYNMGRTDSDTTSQYSQRLQSKELEDRIVSDKPTIPNFTKYIQEIHVPLPYNRDRLTDKVTLDTTSRQWAEKSGVIRELCMLGLKMGIPIYFWVNGSDFMSSNPKTRMDIDDVIEILKKNKKQVKTVFDQEYNTSNNYEYTSGKSQERSFSPLIELLNFNDPSQLSGYTKKWLSDFLSKYNFYKDDFITRVQNNFHNYKSNRSRHYDYLVKLMKDMKIESTKDMLELIYEKWKSKN